MIRVSRAVIRLIKKMGDNIENYRFYVMARHQYAHRSGIFSLDEFCDMLHMSYDYASLHRRPGNNRTSFKKRLSDTLNDSILFSKLPDGRFKINSEKVLISKYDHGTRNGWYNITDPDIIKSKRRFFDFCVGVLVSGNKFRANKKTAEYYGCTVRRIQFATSRNHQNELFIKQYNFVDDFTGTYKEVEKYRAILFNVHGITSPLPKPYTNKKTGKREWVMKLNAPNSYSASVLSGVKGDKAYQAGQAQPTMKVNMKEGCWFIPAFKGPGKKPKKKDKQLNLFDNSSNDTVDPRFKYWYFNEKVYNLDLYIADHSGL